jgi:hypothetical protein
MKFSDFINENAITSEGTNPQIKGLFTEIKKILMAMRSSQRSSLIDNMIQDLMHIGYGNKPYRPDPSYWKSAADLGQ